VSHRACCSLRARTLVTILLLFYKDMVRLWRTLARFNARRRTVTPRPLLPPLPFIFTSLIGQTSHRRRVKLLTQAMYVTLFLAASKNATPSPRASLWLGRWQTPCVGTRSSFRSKHTRAPGTGRVQGLSLLDALTMLQMTTVVLPGASA
jgi:hypothetical protein